MFDDRMTKEDENEFSQAFGTVSIETREGKLVLGLGTSPDAPGEGNPVKLLMSFGQAMALQKALQDGLGLLRRERAQAAVREPGRMW